MKTKSEKQVLNENAIKEITWPQVETWLQAKGWTMKHLRAVAGISAQVLRNIQYGVISKETLEKLAEIMQREPVKLCPRYMFLHATKTYKKPQLKKEYNDAEILALKVRNQELEEWAREIKPSVEKHLEEFNKAGRTLQEILNNWPKITELSLTLIPEGEE